MALTFEPPGSSNKNCEVDTAGIIEDELPMPYWAPPPKSGQEIHPLGRYGFLDAP